MVTQESAPEITYYVGADMKDVLSFVAFGIGAIGGFLRTSELGELRGESVVTLKLDDGRLRRGPGLA